MNTDNSKRFRIGHRARRTEVTTMGCVQRRLVCSVGVSPTGARVRSPVAWIALVEETKLMKPIDKAILRMASENLGGRIMAWEACRNSLK